MKINSIEKTSFNGVKLVGTMPRLQQRQANKLLTKIQNLPGYDLTDKNGITFLISSQKDKSKLFLRRIFTASSIYDKKTNVVRLAQLENTTFSGKGSEILEHIAGEIRQVQRITDKIEAIDTQNKTVKSMLDGLKSEDIVIMWGDKTLNNNAKLFMYYDKQKKCANLITKENTGIGSSVLKHEEFAKGFECDEANRILYLKDGLHSETYNFDGFHTIDDFYPNGNLCKHTESSYSGNYYIEEKYDDLGRKRNCYREDYGVYIEKTEYNPETGEIINRECDTL